MALMDAVAMANALSGVWVGSGVGAAVAAGAGVAVDSGVLAFLEQPASIVTASNTGKNRRIIDITFILFVCSFFLCKERSKETLPDCSMHGIAPGVSPIVP